ncbi:MAG: stage II sporulation protein M [Nanoarchaeota archaeon]
MPAMVLEILISPKAAERNPWEMAFFGFIYASIALFLSLWIFEDNAGMVMVFLTVIACLYLMQSTLRMEEKKDITITQELPLLKEHGRALAFFMFLFIGFVIAFSVWYTVLPQETVSKAFNVQIKTIQQVNTLTSSVHGQAIQNQGLFTLILANNIKVLLFSILFAFFYGAGAIFILAWNASVVGVAIGEFARGAIGTVSGGLGLANIAIYFSSLSLGFFRYMIHGSLEILAYFTAALGAGIISIAVARHEFQEDKFKRILVDSVDLIVISVAILLVAALVEVYITPVFFS